MFASTAEERVRQLRRSHIEIAVAFLEAGRPDGCLATMTDCLYAQARISGLRSALDG